MKKALFTGLILTVAVLTAGAFAQTVRVGTTATQAQVTHKVLVNIPKLVVLKVNSGGSSPVVSFDFTSTGGLSAYEAALNAVETSASTGTTIP